MTRMPSRAPSLRRRGGTRTSSRKREQRTRGEMLVKEEKKIKKVELPETSFSFETFLFSSPSPPRKSKTDRNFGWCFSSSLSVALRSDQNGARSGTRPLCGRRRRPDEDGVGGAAARRGRRLPSVVVSKPKTQIADPALLSRLGFCFRVRLCRLGRFFLVVVVVGIIIGSGSSIDIVATVPSGTRHLRSGDV